MAGLLVVPIGRTIRVSIGKTALGNHHVKPYYLKSKSDTLTALIYGQAPQDRWSLHGSR